MKIPLIGLALLLSFSASEEPKVENDFAELRTKSLLLLDGKQVRLEQRVQAEKPLVLAYTGVGCPISGKYAGRLNQLAKSYGARGVHFLGVNASPQDSREEIEKEKKELGLELEILKDFRQELTRALAAKTTTEVFLFDARGQLRYRGAIDDQYDLGAGKPAPREQHLALALDAVLSGKTPAVAETEAPGCLLTLLPEDELPEAVTWSRDIAPIVQENCESCHRPGQAGPFPLQTYEQAQGWGKMIGLVVGEERMPPWNAHEEFDGIFTNERRLSQDEKGRLLRWIEGGMPRGLPAEDPPARTWPEGWTIGEPDVVFEMQDDLRRRKKLPAEGYAVPREGVVSYQFFTVQTSFAEDRWIQAIETRPGAADVVHHILVFADNPEQGEDMTRRRDAFTSYLAAGVPGDISTIYPAGYGKRLPAGSRLVFQMHYTPNGKERFDRSSVGMVFCDERPEYEVVTDAVFEDGFVIPAGASNHEVRAVKKLYEDTGVVALLPHMHTRGKDFRFRVRYPDGEVEELLAVDFDFNWQESYVLPDPFFLPTGSLLECIGHFDNSEGNPNNPDPTEQVEWGDQSFEEMFIGYYDFVRPLE